MGEVIAVVVGVVSRATPVPIATREMVSPSAAKLTVVVAVAEVVGVQRTGPSPGSALGIVVSSRTVHSLCNDFHV